MSGTHDFGCAPVCPGGLQGVLHSCPGINFIVIAHEVDGLGLVAGVGEAAWIAVVLDFERNARGA